MTARRREAVGCSGAALVDLDGPLTRLFPDPEHLWLAQRLAAMAAADGGVTIPEPVDHVQVLRQVAQHDPAVADDLEREATRAELAAAGTAVAAVGARAFLGAARMADFPVAVVSNNAEDAVVAALRACGLEAFVDVVRGRRAGGIRELKPEPDLIVRALERLGAARSGSVFYGDTVSDMAAAAAAGIGSVGVTEDPERAR